MVSDVWGSSSGERSTGPVSSSFRDLDPGRKLIQKSSKRNELENGVSFGSLKMSFIVSSRSFQIGVREAPGPGSLSISG